MRERIEIIAEWNKSGLSQWDERRILLEVALDLRELLREGLHEAPQEDEPKMDSKPSDYGVLHQIQRIIKDQIG